MYLIIQLLISDKKGPILFCVGWTEMLKNIVYILYQFKIAVFSNGFVFHIINIWIRYLRKKVF